MKHLLPLLVLVASTAAADPIARLASGTPLAKALTPFANAEFSLVAGDVVVFTGSENMVLEQRCAALESRLAEQWKTEAPKFRHMSWEGDTVFRQNRMQDWGSWQSNLAGTGVSVVVAWFGQVEALNPNYSEVHFSAAYGRLLDEFAKHTPRLVLLGPPPFEKHPSIDNTGLNPRVQAFSEATRALAKARGLVFVDLFTPLATNTTSLTRDGMHFTETGMAVVAEIIAKALQSTSVPEARLAKAIVEKNRLWFDTWRCMNWAFAYGDRKTQPFAGPAADKPAFVEELKTFQPRLNHAEAVVHALAASQPQPSPLATPAERTDPPALSPAEQKSRFKVRDGFAVDLFADETNGVVRPIQIRWDAAGRLWVACTPAYPQLQPGEHGNDFILVLEDADGDGRAEKSHRFAERLTMPMGFEFAPLSVGGGIYVCESTQLVHLPDANADDRADARHIVLSGFGTGDTHQNANSLRWGPDGCLWFSQGYHIWSYVETPHGLVELNRSGLWRFNPRTLRLDSFLNESSAGLNCWGTAWDNFGQIFHGSGADTPLWHTTPAIIPTLHPLPLPTVLAKSRGKSMEPEFLHSSHLPPDYDGVLLKSTYYTSQIQLYRLKDAGSSFVSEDLGDLMSGGNEFRPVETRVGPDGAIYVCDWLNPVIGHYQASYRDPRRDRSHGRIWRITANGRPTLPRLNLEKASNAALVGHLGSPERWVRDAAKFALYRKPSAEVLAALNADAAGDALLYELSGIYAAHESANAQIVGKLLASADFRYRAWGVRLVGLWADMLPDALVLLEKAVLDEHPRVRLEAVVACCGLPTAQRAAGMRVASRVMEKPLDAALEYSLTQCIHFLAPQWQPALAAGTFDFTSSPGVLIKLLTTLGGNQTAQVIPSLLASTKLSSAAREQLCIAWVQQGSPVDMVSALQACPESPAVLDAMLATVSQRSGADFELVFKQLHSQNTPLALSGALRLVAITGKSWGSESLVESALADAAAPPAVRAAAMQAVAKLQGTAAVGKLLAFLKSNDPSLHAAAIEAAAGLAPEEVSQAVLPLLVAAKTTKDIAPLLTPLLSQKNGVTALAKAISTAPPGETTAKLALQWMGEIGRDDAAVRMALNAAANISSLVPDYSEALVKRLVSEAVQKGNAANGAALFAAPASTCVACHKVGDTGGNLGPDLTAIGRAMTPEAIVEAVLWPKRQVKEGYMLTQITTKDGQTFQGYKTHETAEVIHLKDTSAPILKNALATRSDTGTLMPEGLIAWMTEQQRLDLLSYLLGLGR